MMQKDSKGWWSRSNRMGSHTSGSNVVNKMGVQVAEDNQSVYRRSLKEREVSERCKIGLMHMHKMGGQTAAMQNRYNVCKADVEQLNALPAGLLGPAAKKPPMSQRF